MFQSVRIACVLHDVGIHPLATLLNTSCVETAVCRRKIYQACILHRVLEFASNLRREELGQAQKLHENVGTALISHIFPEIPETGDRRRFAQFCFWIANRIANEGLAKDTPDGVFGCLHKIVSSNGLTLIAVMTY